MSVQFQYFGAGPRHLRLFGTGGGKGLPRWGWVKLGDAMGSINAHETCSTRYSIKVNDVQNSLSTAVDVGLHHTHAEIGARCIPNGRKPGNKGAQICKVVVFERNEEKNTPRNEATKSGEIGIAPDKDAIRSWGTTTPRVHCPNALWKRAAGS